ncbi:MAG: 6-phosphogluconolactonase [Thermodesulfobacteriota bacterium]
MAFKVIVTRDFDHMSEVAESIVVEEIKRILPVKDTFVLGLATGNTPTGLYKRFVKSANSGAFDCSRIMSFNLDEYIGLPGENPQQRTLHPESYSFFMIEELFGLLDVKFKETNLPWATLVDQARLLYELDSHPNDWEEQGADKGKAIVIKETPQSEYLSWIRSQILDAYTNKISRVGGIDLQIIGVGGRGHVAFHESGIPFEGNKMLLVRLDENTVENAVKDGHFTSKEDSPWYALSMGAELVYDAKSVLLLASGERKVEPIAESLLNDPSPIVPISYGQIVSQKGGTMIYVIDRAAAERILDKQDDLSKRGIELEDRSG